MPVEKKTFKQIIIEDVKDVAESYMKDFPNSTMILTKSYYADHGRIKEEDYAKSFGNFNAMVLETFGVRTRKEYERMNSTTAGDIDVELDDSKKRGKRRYLVTTAVAGGRLDRELMDSMETYCRYNNARLVVLPQRGVLSKEDSYPEEVLAYMSYFVSEYTFNSNLKAKHFEINPQHVNPLTSLRRYGYSSMIIPSPKQQFKVIPGGKKYPKILCSTGSVTFPMYRSTRNGALSANDHVRGGLIVEIEDNEHFHIRQIRTTNEEGGFYDLNKYYQGDRAVDAKAKAFVMGDYHVGDEDPEVVAAWKDCVKLIKPERVFWHDTFNGQSINHHIYKDIISRASVKVSSLEEEMDMVADALDEWTKEFPETEMVIVKSNHDEWIEKYIRTGRYVEDPVNHRIALELAPKVLEGVDPLKYHVEKKVKAKNLRWLKTDESMVVEEFECGIHGHRGPNGSRATVMNLEASYQKSMSGHSHTPEILRTTVRVGTTTFLRLPYNEGPSGWMNTSGIIYPGGGFTLVHAFGSKWRMEDPKKKSKTKTKKRKTTKKAKSST